MKGMTVCVYCGSLALVEVVRPMPSSEGQVLVTKWRCAREFTHWWTGVTDALEDYTSREAA